MDEYLGKVGIFEIREEWGVNGHPGKEHLQGEQFKVNSRGKIHGTYRLHFKDSFDPINGAYELSFYGRPETVCVTKKHLDLMLRPKEDIKWRE